MHRARDHNADGIALRKRPAAGAAQLPPHIRGTQHEASAVRVALRATRSLGQNGYDTTDEQNRSMPIPSVGNHDKIHGVVPDSVGKLGSRGFWMGHDFLPSRPA